MNAPTDSPQPAGQRRFEGSVVLITGAASGIGARTAERFAAEGAAAIVLCDIDEIGLAATAGALRSKGAVVLAQPLNVSSEDAWLTALSAVEARFGRLDVLVNNAGVSIQRTFATCTLEDWNRTIAINQTGVFLGIKHGAAHMRADGGAIVNISSVAGMTGYFSAAYAATKWAVRGMTKSAAMELAGRRIRVNSVHPGLIRTPMTDRMADRASAFTAMTPAARMGEADEIADAVLFLASRQASYVTGAELAVDGGLVAGGGLEKVAREIGIYGA